MTKQQIRNGVISALKSLLGLCMSVVLVVRRAVGRLQTVVNTRYHLRLIERFEWYARWHAWRWKRFTHTHVHALIASSYIVVVAVIMISVVSPIAALSTWTQTDWSGGSGSNTTTQYSSASNLDTTTTPGQLTLAHDEKQSNGGFETNLSGWTTSYDPSTMGSNLKAWYKADAITGLSNGSAVSSWSDSSGNSNTASQGTATNQPTYRTSIINGQPVVRFDGTNDYMGTSFIPPTGANPRTIFTVTSNHSTTGTGRWVYAYGLSPNNTMYGLMNVISSTAYFANDYWNSNLTSSYTSSGTTPIISQVYNGTTDLMYANGTQVGTKTQTLATASGSLRLGARADTVTAYGGFDMAEMLVFDSALTATQRQMVETYLYRKYNISVSTTYDTATRDTTTTHASSTGSMKVTAPVANASATQSINVGDASTYGLEAYAYTNGGTIDSNDAQLYYNGAPVTTTYTAAGGGWYKLSGSVTGAASARDYGVQVKTGKTVYVDDFSVYKYQSSGTLTSNIYDLTFGGDWSTLLYTSSGSGTVTVKVRTSNSPTMSGAPAFSGCSGIASGTDLTGQSCVTNNNRYMQYEITLAPSSLNTPTFSDITIGYTPWDTVAPTTNASALIMKKAVGGTVLNSNDWTNGASPYFEWTAGADNAGGEGMKGYCLYLGTDNTADPVTTKGLLGTSPLNTSGACQFAVASTSVDLATSGYIGTALTSSNSPYYLRIKAIDNVNNVFTGTPAEFQFRFDNTPPSNPAYISAPSQFLSSKQATMTWPTSGGDAASDANSGYAGMQYKIGSTTWYGDVHNGAQDTTDLLTNDGSYTTQDPPDYDNINEGNNLVYFRSWDNAGNISTTYVTTVLKLNTSAPTAPLNVVATPSTNTANSFAFSWAAPSSYSGSASDITYCYTINTLPSNSTCIYTEPGVTSLSAGPYATQPGSNTFYVVAKDSNVNYATAASATFTANTSAPGVPLSTEIADVSTKATSSWKLALSWGEPTDAGAGVANYRIYRSTDNNSFTQIASTAGTSYVDAGLSQQEYFYKVRACDSANNCGAFSSAVSELPTGKFTSPPELVSQPVVTVSTRNATIRWVTDRESDSRVQYGLSSGNYFATEAASSAQTKTHTIELSNLDAGTMYHYRARWTDEDGNIGSSSELSFSTLPAPVIKDVSARRVTTTTAVLQFTVKEASQVKLYYGKTEAFGGVEAINTSRSESTYTIELTGLDDGTSYYYALQPVDSEGNEYKASQLNNFTTPPRPRVTNVRLQPLPEEPTSTQKVTWDTNVPATSLLRLTPQNGVVREVTDSTLQTSHELIVRGLLDDTEYFIVAESRDKDGNLALSDVQTLRTALDTRPPKISNITIESTVRGIGAEARGQIVVSWRTDEPATSQVAFAEGTPGVTLNNKTSEDTSLTQDHVVVISDIATSQVYSVQPISNDAAKNTGTGEAQAAIIGRASDDVITIVLSTIKKIFGF